MGESRRSPIIADASGGESVFGPTGWGSYRWLWLASALSSLGDGMRMTALPLLAVSYTSQAFLLAMVSVAGMMPVLLSPLAGVAADRWSRKLVMIRVDLIRFILIGLLGVAVWTGVSSLAVVCIVALLLGIGEVLFTVTAQTFLPHVVHKTRLSAGGGRLYAAQIISRDTLGQPLGGLLFGLGMALPFVLDAATFLAGVALLTLVQVLAGRPASGAGQRPGWTAMMREGYRYLRADRLLVTLAAMLGIINFFMCGVIAVLVLYVTRRLGIEPMGYGLFLASGAIGGVGGGVFASWIASRLGTFPAALGGLTVAAMCCVVLGLIRGPVVAGALFLAMNFGAVIYQTLTVAFRQASVAAELLGRVNGVYRLFGTGTAPLGALLGGVVAQYLGVQAPFLLAGGAQLLLILLLGPWVIRRGVATERAADASNQGDA